MEVLMPLNALANRCGFFFNCELTPGYEDKPCINDGFNCSHPECGDADEGIGKCLASSCPIAYQASGEDCHDFGVACECVGCPDCECENDMMVCEIPEDEFDESQMYRRQEKEFVIKITETLERRVTVKADTLNEAIKKAQKAHADGKCVLNTDNRIATYFSEVEL